MQSTDPPATAAGTTANARGVRAIRKTNAEAAIPTHAPRDHVKAAQSSMERAEKQYKKRSRRFFARTIPASANGNAMIIK